MLRVQNNFDLSWVYNMHQFHCCLLGDSKIFQILCPHKQLEWYGFWTFNSIHKWKAVSLSLYPLSLTPWQSQYKCNLTDCPTVFAKSALYFIGGQLSLLHSFIVQMLWNINSYLIFWKYTSVHIIIYIEE